MCACICLFQCLWVVANITVMCPYSDQGIEGGQPGHWSFESQHWHRFFFSTPLGPIQPSIQLLEVNHVGHKADNLPDCSAEVKNVTGGEDVVCQ